MRFLGVNIPDEKAVKISLTYVFGLGAHLAKKVCDECCVPQDTKMSKLDQSQLNALSAYIRDNIAFEGDLRKSVSFSIRRLMDIKCYRGVRHRSRLPTRGQRSKTDARTCKGRARVPVAAKKK